MALGLVSGCDGVPREEGRCPTNGATHVRVTPPSMAGALSRRRVTPPSMAEALSRRRVTPPSMAEVLSGLEGRVFLR